MLCLSNVIVILLQVWLIVPIIMVLASVYLLITPFAGEPVESTMALIFIAAGIPVWIIFCWWDKTKHACDDFCGKQSYFANAYNPCQNILGHLRKLGPEGALC